MNKPMTVDEIHGHMTHYNAFKSLPTEVMEDLFTSALTLAVMFDQEAAAEMDAKTPVEADKQEPTKAKMPKRLKS